MFKFKNLVLSSCKEFQNLKSIVIGAMFGAISIVLSSLAIMITQNIRISFTFLPNEFIYYLLGPIFGSFYGAAMDVLGWIISPKGPYFPGFTMSGIVTALIYGFILYKKPIRIGNVILANLIRSLIVDMVLNTYWLSMLYGDAFVALFLLRITKILIMLPIETILLYVVIKAIEQSGVLNMLHKNKLIMK